MALALWMAHQRGAGAAGAHECSTVPPPEQARLYPDRMIWRHQNGCIAPTASHWGSPVRGAGGEGVKIVDIFLFLRR